MSAKWISCPTEKALEMSKKWGSGKRKANTVDTDARRRVKKRKDNRQTSQVATSQSSSVNTDW